MMCQSNFTDLMFLLCCTLLILMCQKWAKLYFVTRIKNPHLRPVKALNSTPAFIIITLTFLPDCTTPVPALRPYTKIPLVCVI